MSFKTFLYSVTTGTLMLFSLCLDAQQNQTVRLSLHFINNIDTEVSIQQMKKPGSGLQFSTLMARIDSTSGMAHFEFDLAKHTDYYWISKVNRLGGQITLAPGDDLIMHIDREKGYSSTIFEGQGTDRNSLRSSVQFEHVAEDEKTFNQAEAGTISYSEVISRKMDLLKRTLQKIETRASLNPENQSLQAFAKSLQMAHTYSTYQELIYYISWFKMKPTEEDHAFLQNLKINNDEAALTSREYLDFTSQYFFYRYRLVRKKMGEIAQDKFAQGLYQGPTLETWKAARLVTKIQRGFAADQDLKSTQEGFTTPELLKDIEQAVLSFKQAQIADYDPGTVFIQGEFSSVKEILDLFQGKVIYIDFWGSWCGPCISSLPNNLRAQKEFAGKEVVFLFLAGNDLEKYWLRAIKKNQISGQHFLMSDTMLEEANELFEINGFPSYSLVDKSGNIVDNKPGKYANRELFDKIEALLKK